MSDSCFTHTRWSHVCLDCQRVQCRNCGGWLPAHDGYWHRCSYVAQYATSPYQHSEPGGEVTARGEELIDSISKTAVLGNEILQELIGHMANHNCDQCQDLVRGALVRIEDDVLRKERLKNAQNAQAAVENVKE